MKVYYAIAQLFEVCFALCCSNPYQLSCPGSPVGSGLEQSVVQIPPRAVLFPFSGKRSCPGWYALPLSCSSLDFACNRDLSGASETKRNVGVQARQKVSIGKA